MSVASFESAFKIPLYMRRQRAGSITFSFFNDDDSDFNDFDDGREIHFYIRRTPSSTPVVDLSEGSGLVINGNEITPSITDVQSNLPFEMYWWELYDVTNKKTIGLDTLQVGSREPIEVETSVEVTMGTTIVRVSMISSESGGGSIVNHWRGGWDASGNAFPATGGSGDGGAISAGDRFYISNVGGGTLASAGESAVPWPQYSIAEYLGSNLWRLT